ncbi:MAG: hypothetical protein ACR2QL_05940 [Woeseiaceae bacterium]
MEFLIYFANMLYLLAYAVRDIMYLRMLTIVATTCLAVYFYNQAQPMMTVVYWNLFFMALNGFQLGRIYKDRIRSTDASRPSVPTLSAGS